MEFIHKGNLTKHLIDMYQECKRSRDEFEERMKAKFYVFIRYLTEIAEVIPL